MFSRKQDSYLNDSPPINSYGNTSSNWANLSSAADASNIEAPALVAIFFESVFALAFKALFFLSLAIAAGGIALGQPFERIGQAVLWGVVVVTGVVGSAFLLQALTLNLKQLFSIRLALQELTARRDLNGDGVIGMPLADASAPEGDGKGIVERVIDLIPSNRGKIKETIESGAVKIDRRDFLAFLHRAWETNGEADKGLARVYWVGGQSRSNPNGSPRFDFIRADGTKQGCTRELYDAIMRKLDSLGEIEGRGNGWSGKLKRDPKEWLVGATYL